MPDYSKSNSEEVVLSLSGVIQDLNFLEFLKKIENLHQKEIINVENLYILERIRTQNTKNFPVSQETIRPLIDLGVVERIGRGRGTRYVLSHKYYVSVGQS
jgi:ATP-dependent DNA helicase RecG